MKYLLFVSTRKVVYGILAAGAMLVSSYGISVVTAQDRMQWGLKNIPSAIASPQAQLIVDPGFEAGPSWPAWTIRTSTAFGSPICNTSLCSSNGGTTAPFAGTNWTWLGGTFAGQVEDASIGQTVTIPAGGTASLTFRMKLTTVTTPFTDTMAVKVDGVTQQTFTEPIADETSYTLRTVNLTSFANGAPHVISFVYHSNDGFSSFLLDDINLTTSPATAAGVTVSGRLLTSTGRGIVNARVSLTNPDGTIRYAYSRKGGRYQFEDVEVGSTYVFTAQSRQFQFENPTRIISLTDAIADLDFVGTSTNGSR